MKKRKSIPHHLKIEDSDDKKYLLKKRGLNNVQLEYVETYPLGLTNYFNSLIACIYGVNASIFFNHVSYWVCENEKKKINFRDGKYWTYGSLEHLITTYFPYFTISNLRTAIDKLLEDRIIIRNVYNSHPYDRTIWYTVNSERIKRILEGEYYDLIKS